MESSPLGSDVVPGSKILLDRGKFWKNTIYLNPRVLKSASRDLTQPSVNNMNVSQAYTGVSMNLTLNDRQYPGLCKPLLQGSACHEIVGSYPSTTKRMYLNPHFQRTAPNSVHINPKKLSQVIDCSKEVLLNVQPYGHQYSDMSEIYKSNSLCDNSNLVAFYTQNDRCSIQQETNSTYNADHYNSSALDQQLKKYDSMSMRSPGNNSLVRKSGSYNRLVRISDTKLVRMPDKSKSWSINRALQKTMIRQTCQMFTKDRPAQLGKNIKKKCERQKKSLCSQSQRPPFTQSAVPYKLTQRVLPAFQGKEKSELLTSLSFVPSKYKIDRRLTKSRLLKNSKKVSHRRESLGNCHVRRNVVSKCSYMYPVFHRSRTPSAPKNTAFNDGRKIIISSRKLLRIGSTTKVKNLQRKEDQTSHTRLVRIGGVLYRTSRTKLMKSKTSESCTKPVVKRRKIDRSHIIYIRGNKFVMDATGKTLKQIPRTISDNCVKNSKSMPVKRVDIGGITFVQKSSDLLVRTNTHTARNIVNQAKNKSIAMLTNKLRKINQPCAFFRRFGKCPRRDKGMCQLVHDPKQVALCRRFLHGECNLSSCLLSHNVVPEKMPTCKYFLEGCCGRENCPYLHVKLNSKAVICEKFLQGYCAEGPRCKKRHSYVCPEYEKLGTCQKGKYCPYPHKTDLKYIKKTVLNQAKQIKSDHPLGDLHKKRYYQEEKNKDTDSCSPEEEILQKSKFFLQQKEDGTPPHLQLNLEETVTHKGEAVVKRPRIGRLPSFIALDH